MPLEEADTTLEHEGDREVGRVGCIQVGSEVRKQRIFSARDQRAAVGCVESRMPCIVGFDVPVSDNPARAGWGGEVVCLGWDHVAHASQRMGDVTVVAGNYMQVEMEDRLPSCTTNVDAKVVAIWPVRPLDLASRDPDSGHELCVLFVGGVEPRRDVAPGHEECMAGAHWEGVPKSQDELVCVEDTGRLRRAERAGVFAHVDRPVAPAARMMISPPSSPASRQAAQRQR